MMDTSRARQFLSECHAQGDFHKLSPDVVEALLEVADLVKYRKPRNANGSRARCFHAYLTRRADSLQGMADEECKGQNCTVTMRRGGRSVTASSY